MEGRTCLAITGHAGWDRHFRDHPKLVTAFRVGTGSVVGWKVVPSKCVLVWSSPRERFEGLGVGGKDWRDQLLLSSSHERFERLRVGGKGWSDQLLFEGPGVARSVSHELLQVDILKGNQRD